MDLNYLFFRQQVEHSRAESGANEPARKVHAELARKYEEQIEALTPKEFHFPSSNERAATPNQPSTPAKILRSGPGMPIQ